MSVFLSAFLGCLLAFFVFASLFAICMVVAIIEYKKRQKKKFDDMQAQVNAMFNTGGDK